MAEREGFEPSVRFPVHMISNHAHSATLSPLLIGQTETVSILFQQVNRKHQLLSVQFEKEPWIPAKGFF